MRRVLIVGENLKEKCEHVMRGFGSHVTCATTSGEALQLVSRDAFDVVLLDARHLAALVGPPPPGTKFDDSTTLAPPLSDSVREILILIERRHREPAFKLRTAARELGVSREHLCRALRRETGRSFLQHLYTVRVREAERLLRTTALRVKEIAAQTGFHSTSHMDACFRRLHGGSPNSYRRNGHAK